MPDFSDIQSDSIVETYQDNSVQAYSATPPATSSIVKEFNMDKTKSLMIMQQIEGVDISSRSNVGTGTGVDNPANAIDNDFITQTQFNNVEVEKEQIYDFGSIATRDLLLDWEGGSVSNNVSGYYELSDDDVTYAPEVLIASHIQPNREQHAVVGISFRYIKLSYRRVTGSGTGIDVKLYILQEPTDGGISDVDLKVEIKDQVNNVWRDWISTIPQKQTTSTGVVQQLINIDPHVTDNATTKYDRVLPAGVSLLRMTQTITARVKHTIQLIKVF